MREGVRRTVWIALFRIVKVVSKRWLKAENQMLWVQKIVVEIKAEWLHLYYHPTGKERIAGQRGDKAFKGRKWDDRGQILECRTCYEAVGRMTLRVTYTKRIS